MERLDFIFNYVLDQAVQVSVLVILVACLTFVLRNRSAHVRYLLWLVVLAKCLIPPLVTVSVPQVTLPAVTATADMSFEDVTKTVVLFDGNRDHTDGVIPSSTPVSPTGMNRSWSLVWLWGCVAFLLLALVKACFLTLRLRQQRRPLTPVQQQRAMQLACDLGRSRIPRFWQIDNLSQPFVWGFPCGAIYVPGALWERHSEAHVRCSLAHELMHVMRWDALINALQILAQAIFWFHPLIWWTNHRLRHERERCCDEAVIALLNTPSEVYGETIIATLASAKQGMRLQSSLAIAGPLRGIEKRLKSIMKANKRFEHKPNWVTILVIGCMGLVMVPTAWQPGVAVADEVKEPSGSSEISKDQPIKMILYDLLVYEVDSDILVDSYYSYQPLSVGADVEFAQKLAELAKQATKVSIIANPKIFGFNKDKATFEIIGDEYFMLPPGVEEPDEVHNGLSLSVTGFVSDDGVSVDLLFEARVNDVIVSENIIKSEMPLQTTKGIKGRVTTQWQKPVVIRGLNAPGITGKSTVFVLTASPQPSTHSQSKRRKDKSRDIDSKSQQSSPRLTEDQLIKRTEFIQNDAMVKALVQKQVDLEMELMDLGEKITPDNLSHQHLQRKLETVLQRLEEQKERVGQIFDQAWEAEQQK